MFFCCLFISFSQIHFHDELCTGLTMSLLFDEKLKVNEGLTPDKAPARTSITCVHLLFMPPT